MIRLTAPPSVPPASFLNATCLSCGEEIYRDPDALALGESAICASCLEVESLERDKPLKP
ncbi:MAG: hypothetical protein ACE5JD_12995 [Candidatus Methylomirabilia bacterium]